MVFLIGFISLSHTLDYDRDFLASVVGSLYDCHELLFRFQVALIYSAVGTYYKQ